MAVVAAVATVDLSDICGSGPHHRDPSGATSDEQRGFGPAAYRIGRSRVLLSACPSAAILAAFLVLSLSVIRYAAIDDDVFRCSHSTATPIAQMTPNSTFAETTAHRTKIGACAPVKCK